MLPVSDEKTAMIKNVPPAAGTRPLEGCGGMDDDISMGDEYLGSSQDAGRGEPAFTRIGGRDMFFPTVSPYAGSIECTAGPLPYDDATRRCHETLLASHIIRSIIFTMFESVRPFLPPTPPQFGSP